MHFHVIMGHFCLCQSSVTQSQYNLPCGYNHGWLWVIEKAIKRGDLEIK